MGNVEGERLATPEDLREEQEQPAGRAVEFAVKVQVELEAAA